MFHFTHVIYTTAFIKLHLSICQYVQVWMHKRTSDNCINAPSILKNWKLANRSSQICNLVLSWPCFLARVTASLVTLTQVMFLYNSRPESVWKQRQLSACFYLQILQTILYISICISSRIKRYSVWGEIYMCVFAYTVMHVFLCVYANERGYHFYCCYTTKLDHSRAL